MSGATLPFPSVSHQKEKEKERRLAKFEIIQGGLSTSGGNPPPGNWLMDLPVGAQFAAQSKLQRDNFMVLTLEVWRKTDRYMRLWDTVGDKLFGDVNPLRFTNTFECLEMIHDPRTDGPKEQETTSEQADG